MKPSLRFRYFLWLLGLLGIFVVVQALLYGTIELVTMTHHPELEMREQLMEVVVGVGLNLLLLPLLGLAAWWIAKRMLQPIRTLAQTAERIGAGDLDQRVPSTQMPDDETRALGTVLNHAFDRYQSALRRLDRFTGDASHQLRTPLASMRTTAEVALTRARTPNEYRDVLSSILEDIGRLSHLVDQLLTMAQMDAGRQARSFEAIEVKGLLQDLAALYTPTCTTMGITLECDLAEDDMAVQGNRDLLGEAIRNILDNALRHVGEGGILRIEAARHKDGTSITLLDSGPGIPAEHAETIFERFHSVPRADAGGAGLGLALARDIIRNHGGDILLTQRQDWGAVFELQLPTASPEA